ncbi:hypothetical protein [Desulfonatronum parangueonense]
MVRTYLETTTARLLLDQGRLRPVEDWGPGFAHVFITHDQDWSFGVVDVQGQVKFAEPLVRRALRERRELTEGDRLWLYRVASLGGGRFQAVYGIFSGERFEALTQTCRERIDGTALHDGVSVVLGLLKGCRVGRIRAVIVLISGTAVVGIGDCRNCHWLVRMVVNDGRLEPVLERVRAEAAWRKLSLQGIDLVRILDDAGPVPLSEDVRQWPARGYIQGDGQYLSSLESLLPRLPLDYCPASREERLLRPLERAEPLAWAALAAAGAVLFGFGFWQQERAVELEVKTSSVRDQIQAVAHTQFQAPFQAPSQNAERVDPSADLATHAAWGELNRLRDAVGPALERPLIGDALARLAAAAQGTTRIAEIAVSEGPETLVLRIKGGLATREGDAGVLFQRFLLGLSAQGFGIEDRLLEMAPGGTKFSVTASLGRSETGKIAVLAQEGAP